ncbi:MAG: CHAT domain-containing protein, partial [Cyanobacteria bacterium J06649_11]
QSAKKVTHTNDQFSVFGATESFPANFQRSSLAALPKFNKLAQQFLPKRFSFSNYLYHQLTTTQTFFQNAPQSAFSLILGHGWQDKVYRDSFYLQFQPNLKDKHGKVGTSAIASQHLNNILLISLNCHSADGSVQTVEGRKNMAHAFLQSGCLGVISGEGIQFEKETTEIMQYYFTAWLAEQQSALLALRSAKLQYRNNHPNGDPQRWSSLNYYGLDSNMRPALD